MKEETEALQGEFVEKRYPFEYTISVIEGKWKVRILYFLWVNECLRYGELKMELKGITHKMLSRQLKELEADEMIIRKEYMQIPPKVEYFLTEKGKSLMPLVDEICKWGEENRPNAEAFEAQHKWHLG